MSTRNSLSRLIGVIWCELFDRETWMMRYYAYRTFAAEQDVKHAQHMAQRFFFNADAKSNYQQALARWRQASDHESAYLSVVRQRLDAKLAGRHHVG